VGQVGVLTIPIIPLRDFGQKKMDLNGLNTSCKAKFFLYLSEADGHWIILEEIEFGKRGNHPLTVDYGRISKS
jgi:hypothetical protein